MELYLREEGLLSIDKVLARITCIFLSSFMAGVSNSCELKETPLSFFPCSVSLSTSSNVQIPLCVLLRTLISTSSLE